MNYAWLITSLTDWPTGWLRINKQAGRQTERQNSQKIRQTACLPACQTDWRMIDWCIVTDILTDSQAYWLTGLLTHSLTHSLMVRADGQSDWLADWLTDRRTDRRTNRLTDGQTDVTDGWTDAESQCSIGPLIKIWFLKKDIKVITNGYRTCFQDPKNDRQTDGRHGSTDWRRESMFHWPVD